MTRAACRRSCWPQAAAAAGTAEAVADARRRNAGASRGAAAAGHPVRRACSSSAAHGRTTCATRWRTCRRDRVNHRMEEGLASSLRVAAWRSTTHADAPCLILGCDQPALEAAHLQDCWRAQRAASGCAATAHRRPRPAFPRVVIACDACGRRGHAGWRSRTSRRAAAPAGCGRSHLLRRRSWSSTSTRRPMWRHAMARAGWTLSIASMQGTHGTGAGRCLSWRDQLARSACGDRQPRSAQRGEQPADQADAQRPFQAAPQQLRRHLELEHHLAEVGRPAWPRCSH